MQFYFGNCQHIDLFIFPNLSLLQIRRGIVVDVGFNDLRAILKACGGIK